MDVRLSAEQVALRDSVTHVVDRLGPKAVGQLQDTERATKLDAAVEASGWRQLRTPGDGGAPWASGVEVAIVAEELARGVADTPFLGPVLAAELRRLSGAPAAEVRQTVALATDLGALGDGVAIDAAGAAAALGLRGDTVVELPLEEALTPVDLTRGSARVGADAAPVGRLPAEGLTRWTAFGLAVSCADLVGAMRGALGISTEYAKQRAQYGTPIGAFQAVQHLLADGLVAAEGARSIALHSAWAVDALEPAEALGAAAAAKAYCARAARAVCETAIQVHGGIGNTWECTAHLFVRRALLSADLLGGIGPNLVRVLARHGIGGCDELR